MDFMFLNKDDQTVLDFDARAEIVTKDRFFESAQKYILYFVQNYLDLYSDTC